MSGGADAPDVAIVDDHGVVARALATTLETRELTVRVVDPAGPAPIEEAVAGARTVLLDLDLGDGRDGRDLVAPLTAAGHRVVVLTGVEQAARLVACLDEGAVAVLSKAARFERLADAVALAADGVEVLHPHEVAELRARAREEARDAERRLGALATLTDREAAILGGLVRGRSAAQIAEASVVSVATVRSQIGAVLRKLDVPSALAAVARAREAGWEPPAGA